MFIQNCCPIPSAAVDPLESQAHYEKRKNRLQGDNLILTTPPDFK